MTHASRVYGKTTSGSSKDVQLKISLLQAVEQQLAGAARIDPQIPGRRRTREKAKNSQTDPSISATMRNYASLD